MEEEKLTKRKKQEETFKEIFISFLDYLHKKEENFLMEKRDFMRFITEREERQYERNRELIQNILGSLSTIAMTIRDYFLSQQERRQEFFDWLTGTSSRARELSSRIMEVDESRAESEPEQQRRRRRDRERDARLEGVMDTV